MVSNKDLGNKLPYELVTESDEDMHLLMRLLGFSTTPADKVNLLNNNHMLSSFGLYILSSFAILLIHFPVKPL